MATVQDLPAFQGSIAELEAELIASGIDHRIAKKSDAYLEIDLKGSIVITANVDLWGSRSRPQVKRTPSERRSSRYAHATLRQVPETAVGTIRAVANGAVVDLIVDLETDSTKPMYKEVNERWQQFFAHLTNRDRLVLPKSMGQPEASEEPRLTDREKEVAQLYAAGYGVGEIANKLIISRDTVKTYSRALSDKWELDSTKRSLIQSESKKRGYG